MVAPFLSDNDPFSGSISYEVHQRTNSENLFPLVDSVINEYYNNTGFTGSWLILTQWENVKPFRENNAVSYAIFNAFWSFCILPQTNTFQGILVTDFTTYSYSIFTYFCGDMEISDSGQIGFGSTGSLTVTHGATYREHPHFISCLNQPDDPWVNVVYEIASSGKQVK